MGYRILSRATDIDYHSISVSHPYRLLVRSQYFRDLKSNIDLYFYIRISKCKKLTLYENGEAEVITYIVLLQLA